MANNAGAKFKTVTDKSFAPEQYGIAVKKGNAELLAKLNKGLADIKADGSYDKIYAQYFGAPPAAAPAGPRSLEVSTRRAGDGSALGDPRRLRAAVRAAACG